MKIIVVFEKSNLVPKVESMTKLRPGLSGNPFSVRILFGQKRLGAEYGDWRPKIYYFDMVFIINLFLLNQIL